jgi:hypothetical protein
MGWHPDDVARCGLSEFNAAWEGFSTANGLGGTDKATMTPDEAREAHREFFG